MKTKAIETKDKTNCQTEIESLFKDSNDLAGDPETIFRVKNTLLMLALELIKSERIDGAIQESRNEFSFHLAVLNDIMDNLYECNNLPVDEKLTFFEKFTNEYIEHAERIKETLNELALVYIRSEEIEGSNQVIRGGIADHFYILNSLIDDRIKYSQLVEV